MKTLDVPGKYEGDVENHQMVAMQGDKVRVQSPLAMMTKEQALIHAAWIVAIADRSEDYTEFREILKRVLGA
jgi:hypothetical protein